MQHIIKRIGEGIYIVTQRQESDQHPFDGAMPQKSCFIAGQKRIYKRSMKHGILTWEPKISVKRGELPKKKKNQEPT